MSKTGHDRFFSKLDPHCDARRQAVDDVAKLPADAIEREIAMWEGEEQPASIRGWLSILREELSRRGH